MQTNVWLYLYVIYYRLLQHSGVSPDYTKEPSDLATGWPNVESVTLLLGKWWGSGILHAKVWISDERDVYIGSANNDWKSLTQVLSELYSWLPIYAPPFANLSVSYFSSHITCAHSDSESYR